MTATTKTPYAATRNACKLCTPFGACLAFKGLRGCLPFLHGSQGCATYVRRYMISHFRDPVDIASSNFSEETAVFGGERNLAAGLDNVIRQYRPEAVGIATTCLSETIGDDVPHLLRRFRASRPPEETPPLIHASTPSYRGTHAEGYQAAVRAMVDALAAPAPRHGGINLVPGMLSPADLRLLRDIGRETGLEVTLLPDYGDTLDGVAWDDYRPLPEGGTPVEAVRAMGGARATIHMTSTADPDRTAAGLLANRYGVPAHFVPLPIGLRQTDAFMDTLAAVGGTPLPPRYAAERGRLVDAYVDAHKYLFDKRAVVYGEEDWVAALVGFLAETGIRPVLAVSGGRSGRLAARVHAVSPRTDVLEGADFEDLGERLRGAAPDLLVGSSKGYRPARDLGVPLVRVGFPVHDRFGGARLLHVGYAGTQALFDRIVNALLEKRQGEDDWGYTYL